MGFNTWSQYMKLVHGLMIAVNIILSNFHGFKLFNACLFFNLVFSFISIVLQVSNICDVPHITDFIANLFKVSEKKIVSNGRSCMSKVWITVDSRSTYVHSNPVFMNRLENFFFTMQSIVNDKIHRQ